MKITDNKSNVIDIAVLLIFFNRKSCVKEVLTSIRDVKPTKLYLASDGPRNEIESHIVNDIRSYVEESIDWDCEILKLYHKTNLGCRMGPVSAISWLFSNEDRAIILEDDCVPSKDFFYFCSELLDVYESDRSVFSIGGHAKSFFKELVRNNSDYDYSKYSNCWGWATWKDRWELFDSDIADWPLNRARITKNISQNKETRKFWKDTFNRIHNGDLGDVWDYQFMYLLMKNSGKAIIPYKNLVSNIGFGRESTHTKDANDKDAFLPIDDFEWPIHHPSEQNTNKLIDDRIDLNYVSELTLKKVIRKIISWTGISTA